MICLDDYDPEDDLRVMSCKHFFHQTCVDRWLQTGRNNCPACRTKVSLLLAIYHECLHFVFRVFRQAMILLTQLTQHQHPRSRLDYRLWCKHSFLSFVQKLQIVVSLTSQWTLLQVVLFLLFRIFASIIAQHSFRIPHYPSLLLSCLARPM